MIINNFSSANRKKFLLNLHSLEINILIIKQEIFNVTEVTKGSKLKLLNEKLATMTICNLILENLIYLTLRFAKLRHSPSVGNRSLQTIDTTYTSGFTDF